METETNDIFVTQDGSHSVFSQRYGVSYHSKYGAVQESRHVFIEAGLYPAVINRKSVAILEIGLGAALNAFLTLIEAERRALQVYYEAIEAYPLSPQQARRLNYPSLLGTADLERQFLLLHESPWEENIVLTPHFTFRKVLALAESMDYRERFDVVYFDAFAPNAQPELWETAVLSLVYNALKPLGSLVTYCAKGEIKRRLRDLGFAVEKLPGPPGKREMTRCIKPPPALPKGG